MLEKGVAFTLIVSLQVILRSDLSEGGAWANDIAASGLCDHGELDGA